MTRTTMAAATAICIITPSHAEAHTWECWANSHDRFINAPHVTAETKHEPWIGHGAEPELKSAWEKTGLGWQRATVEFPGQKMNAIYFFNDEFASHDFQFGTSPTLIFRTWVDHTGILFQSFSTTPLQVFNKCRFTN